MNEDLATFLKNITETVTHIIFNIDLVNIPVVFQSKNNNRMFDIRYSDAID